MAVARAALAEEARTADRLENKARQQVLISAQWFAIVQAVFAVALNNRDARGTTFEWVAASLAVMGAVTLGLAVVSGWLVWRLRLDEDISPQGLMKMLHEAKQPDTRVLEDLVVHHASLLGTKRALNRRRSKWARLSEYGWFAAMAVPVAELICALAAILTA